MGIFDNLTDNYSIGANIGNYVNDKPMQSSTLTSAIDNYVNSGNGQTEDFTKGLKALHSLFGGSQNNKEQMPLVEFKPKLFQPQFLNTNFNNQASYLAGAGNRGLYNYLMR